MNKASSLAEWQKVAQDYLLYVYMKGTSETDTSPIGFDNVTVAEGNIYS